MQIIAEALVVFACTSQHGCLETVNSYATYKPEVQRNLQHIEQQVLQNINGKLALLVATAVNQKAVVVLTPNLLLELKPNFIEFNFSL